MSTMKKYGLNDMPPMREAVPFSLQHVLLMIASTLAVPIIVAGALSFSGIDTAFLIQCAIFTAGVTTMVQAFGLGPVGSKLPIVMGCTFTFISPAIVISLQYGIGAFFGAVIVGGIIEALLGSYLMNYTKKLFPPIVTGSVVMVIGLSLMGVAIDYSAGINGLPGYGSWQNYALAFFTLAVILLVNRLSKGFIKGVSVLIGTVVAFVVSVGMGMVDFTAVNNAAWFAIPTPFKYGIEFKLAPILIVTLLYMVSMIEYVGDTTGVAMIAVNREPTQKELSAGVKCDGLGSAFSGIFNALPNVSYSGNIGLVALTGVYSRYVVGLAGLFITLIGFIPKFSTMFSLIPAPIIGGATIVMFGLVATAGLRLLRMEKLTERNLLIIAISICIGLGFAINPQALAAYPFYISAVVQGIPGTAISAMILNLIFPRKSEEEEEIEDLHHESAN